MALATLHQHPLQQADGLVAISVLDYLKIQPR